STDNLARPASELAPLLQIIENLCNELAADGQPWRLRMVGALDLLPANHAAALKAAEERTVGRDQGAQVNLAICYGGRREIADAVRSLLQEYARAGMSLEEAVELLDVDHIAQHLYTRGQPDPDLVIRTSGEQRLGGFLLWQSAYSEFDFCDVNCPSFPRVDFLRALRSYAHRQRRLVRGLRRSCRARVHCAPVRPGRDHWGLLALDAGDAVIPQGRPPLGAAVEGLLQLLPLGQGAERPQEVVLLVAVLVGERGSV